MKKGCLNIQASFFVQKIKGVVNSSQCSILKSGRIVQSGQSRGKEEVSEEVVNQIQKKVVESYGKYFTQIDYSKFKPEVNPVQIMNMLKWMAEGYLNELRRTNQPIVMEEILAEYKSWSDMFRTIAYKEDRKNE